MAAYYVVQAAHSSAAQEAAVARQRVEAQHPELVREVLRAARRYGVMVFNVSDKSVGRALVRHYTEAVAEELVRTQDELASALVQAAALREQLQAAQAEAREARLQLEDARDAARVGYEPPRELRVEYGVTSWGDGPMPQLYEVQAVRELGQVATAVQEGSALATLQGQLVMVRPAHVYGADTAPVQASTVLALGACVCTAEGLLAAQLPVPERGA